MHMTRGVRLHELIVAHSYQSHRRLRALAISSDYRYGKLHECSQKPTRVTYFRTFPERPDTGWATACSAAGAVSVLASGGGAQTQVSCVSINQGGERKRNSRPGVGQIAHPM